MTQNQIKKANSTSRSSGASAIDKDGNIRSVVAKYVSENIDKNLNILDFGAGKGAIQTKWLRDQGFSHITAYEMGDNVIDGIHDAHALENGNQYDVIFASNVLNVQDGSAMLVETLNQIDHALKDGGILICNYPQSPRYWDIDNRNMLSFLREWFGPYITKVGGTYSAPVWKIIKNN